MSNKLNNPGVIIVGMQIVGIQNVNHVCSLLLAEFGKVQY